jgi:hypothetical protein
VLHFVNQDVRIRETVKYTNYKRFAANTKILYEGKEVEKAPEGEAPRKDEPKK